MPHRTLVRLAMSAPLLLAADIASAICHVTVDGTATNDGSSWSQAMNLQTALTTPACSEVWVAAGMYRPGVAGDRSATFRVHAGTSVYGGFAGDETARDARDWLAHPTVLSGDIGGDDPVDARGVLAQATDIVGANSYHVVYMSQVGEGSGTVLDGFTITAGDAVGMTPPDGGGLRCHAFATHCSPLLRNLRFAGNRSTRGGGLSVTTDTNGRSVIALERVRFDGNVAGLGAAVWLQGRTGTLDATFNEVEFDGNVSSGEGGAVKISGRANVAFHATTFHGNTAAEGGAVAVDAAYGNVDVRFANVTMDGNAAMRGGAVRSEAFAMYGAGLTFDNSTLTDNMATSAGQVLNSVGPLHGITFRNSLVWGNGEADDPMGWVIYAEVTPVFDHVLTQFACPACTDSVVGDPVLGPLGFHGGAVPTRVPGTGSAAVDAGNDAFCSGADVGAVDARGVQRPQGPRCDIGAVERAPGDRTALFGDGFEASLPQ